MSIDARELIKHVTVRDAEFGQAYAGVLRSLAANHDMQRALEADDCVDQRGDGDLLVELSVAGRRVAEFGQQCTGDSRFFRKLVDLGCRVLNRVAHGLAPSRDGEGSVGGSPAQGRASSAGDGAAVGAP